MALISNIYYNLAAWASGTFTAGQRVSNAGNAYQCVTGGTGSIAPTGTGSSISGGGTVVWKWLSAVDYTSLASWAAALPTTLTQAVVARLWNTGVITTTVGTAWLTLSGHTTTPSNNITITCAPGESFADYLAANPSTPLAFSTSTGVAFQLPSTGSGGINYFNLQDDNVVWSGIQVQDPNSTSNSTILSSNHNITIKNSIFDGYGQAGGAVIVQLGASLDTTTSTVINTLIIDRCAAPGTSAAAVNIGNNLVVAGVTHVALNSPSGAYGWLNQGSGATSKLTDSILLGYAAGSTFGSSNTGATTISYSIFSAASITGSNLTLGSGIQYTQTAAGQFVNASTNFRLIGTASAINAGTTDTTDIPAANDILGTTRPQGSAWDIGAYEVPVVTAAGTIAGQATVSAVGSGVYRSSGTIAGQASVSATSGTANTAGTIAGKASVSAVGASTAAAVGTIAGQASVAGFNATGSVNATIIIDPISPQRTGQSFVVTGTYNLYPDLQYSDDSTGSYTPIPVANLTPMGTQTFSFVHPSVAVAGSYQLVVTDESTNISGTANFIVNAAPTIFALPMATFPPPGPPGLTKTINAYLYQQYADDDNLQALVKAYNELTQAYLDWFNQIDLPIYTGLSGSLLDWVAQGLYGMTRPNLTTSTSSAIGPFNTYPYDTLAMATSVGTAKTTVFTITDDLFKRFITWNFYKGDGFTFNTTWLKRRVMRFLGGVNGVDYGVSETYQVSVKYPDKKTINIGISAGSQPTTYGPILAAAINSGVCQLPFQYTYNVLLS